MMKPPARPTFYDPLDWVVIRSPLLPIDAYLALAGGSSSSHTRPTETPPTETRSTDTPSLSASSPPGGASSAVAPPAARRWRTEARASARPADPLVKLALLVGGGHLLDALDERGHPNADARGKLLRYQIRMSTRPTPYGIFAGVALGTFGTSTTITLDEERAIRRSRPDMEWLLSFVGAMEARPDIRRQLTVAAHPALFARSGRVFLSDPTPLANQTEPAAVSLRDSRAVRAVLARARVPIAWRQLVEEVRTELDVTDDKVEQLVTELWKQGLLLTDLRPPLTIASPAAHVLARLQALPEPPPEARALQAALDALGTWDRLPTEDAAAGWPALEAALHALHAGVETPIQVDLGLRLTSARIHAQVAVEAARAAEALLRMTPVPHGAGHLSAYRAAFEGRYGPDREVPLLELLDPNFGLGPPSAHGGMAGVDGRRLAVRNETLQSMALTAMMQGRAVIEIDDATLERLSLWRLDGHALPLSLDLAIFVIAPSMTALDQGAFQIAVGPNLGAQQAGRYVARFSDLLGAPAERALTQAAEAEARHAPAALWAELVYLPRRLRSGNVVVRPAIRDREIPVGVPPGVPLDRAIPLEELTVGVHGGRFRLRWRGTEVMVRAGHMLTNFHAPQICRFLDDLADDGVAQLSSFDWGPAFSYPFLPRIVYERCIVSPARWRIDAAMRDAELPTHPRDFPEKLARFREQWKLPRACYLALNDNRLLLDLDAPDQADVLRVELANLHAGAALVLHEALPGPEHAWLEGSDGRYIVELVVPLVLRPFERAATAPAVEDEAPPGDISPASVLNRLRPPGSDWLFVKLYCPAVLEEEFLIGPVRDFCHEMRRRGLADAWFFVRYADPDIHVRLRFRGDPNRLLTGLLPEICAWGGEVIAEGLCRRFSFDTYDREIERYGGPASLAIVESIFSADSPATLDLLVVLRKASDVDRLTLAVASIDDLLSALGLDDTRRHAWYTRRVKTPHVSGPDFRERKVALRSMLGHANGVAGLEQGAAIVRLFEERRRSLASVAARFAALADNGSLGKPLDVILDSIVHMHCNRLAGAERGVEERALGLLLRVRQSLAKAPIGSSRRS